MSDKIVKRILVTGGHGLVGSALQKITKTRCSMYFPHSSSYDLRDRKETRKMFLDYRPDYVIHLAAKVGGLGINMKNLGSMYTENIYINTNVLEEARLAGVEKVVSVLSTCVYPAEASFPLTEDQLHSGMPHDSNEGYAFVKRMLDVQSRMYRKQYGSNFVCVIPTNLFGDNDNYDLYDSHMVPAVIRKVYEAKVNNKSEVVFWGDGSPLREFLCANDFARILLKVLENYDEEYPLNVGNGKEVSVKEVVEKVCNLVGYCGTIIWDTMKSNGIQRKPSSNKKMLSQGWWRDEDFTDFDVALKETVDWFKQTYPHVRGVNV